MVGPDPSFFILDRLEAFLHHQIMQSIQGPFYQQFYLTPDHIAKLKEAAAKGFPSVMKAWEEIADDLGFVPASVQPLLDRGDGEFVIAIPHRIH